LLPAQLSAGDEFRARGKPPSPPIVVEDIANLPGKGLMQA